MSNNFFYANGDVGEHIVNLDGVMYVERKGNAIKIVYQSGSTYNLNINQKVDEFWKSLQLKLVGSVAP